MSNIKPLHGRTNKQTCLKLATQKKEIRGCKLKLSERLNISK